MGMQREIVEPFELAEVYVDSFGKYEVTDDTLTCVGYRVRKSGEDAMKVGVIRIIMPVKNLPDTIANALEAAKGLAPGGLGDLMIIGKVAH